MGLQYRDKGGDIMVLEDKKMGRDMDNHAKWERENLRSYTFKVNIKTDKDICEHLERQPNKRAYIISLIRKDMQNN